MNCIRDPTELKYVLPEELLDERYNYNRLCKENDYYSDVTGGWFKNNKFLLIYNTSNCFFKIENTSQCEHF